MKNFARTMGKKIAVIAMLMMNLACIEIHVSLFVRGDGSGRGKIRYVIVKGIYKAPDEEKIAINEDKLAAHLAKREGVEVIKTGSSYKDENLIEVWGEFRFSDVTKLSDGFITYTFANLGGTKRELRISYRLTGELHRRELFSSFFKGLSSSAEVEVDGKIVSTNGKLVSPRKARWEISAEEVVGRDVSQDMIVIFEARKDGILQRIKRKLKL